MKNATVLWVTLEDFNIFMASKRGHSPLLETIESGPRLPK